jgi:hypothetical protein
MFWKTAIRLVTLPIYLGTASCFDARKDKFFFLTAHTVATRTTCKGDRRYRNPYAWAVACMLLSKFGPPRGRLHIAYISIYTLGRKCFVA